MRSPAPFCLLLCLLATAALVLAAPTPASDDITLEDDDAAILDDDGDHEPVVRKKRTFGDIVFRGLADVLGYSVSRKPPQAAFPPPLAPVPGIDTPLQAATTPAPAPALAVAPAPAQAAPCGAARAVGPPLCRAQRPPKPKAAAPCPKPKAAARAKPKPPPPKPPSTKTAPPPCGQPRANPATPAPCNPAPPPPPKPQAENNLERVSSNFQLNFNFNRRPVTQAATADTDAAADPQLEQEPEQQQAAPVTPVAIQPRAAKLPTTEPRNPRVYVDAFLVRNGVAQRVDTLDANRLNPQRIATTDDDFLSYEDEAEAPLEDDYEDAQESRDDRTRAVQDFGVAVDRFWDQKKPKRKQRPQSLPSDDYRNVHFGERDFDGQVRLQSLQRDLDAPDAEDDAEATTTTEDPKRSLRPRVLPPTEHNPNQIDTVTVRVPPIYREKHPRKLHDGDGDAEDTDDFGGERPQEPYADGEEGWDEPSTERPRRRRRRRKQHRTARSVDESEPYSAGEYDYYGKKLPISDEEKFYMQLTIPPPTKDPDLARHEVPQKDHFLDDHERLRDENERIPDRKTKGDVDRPLEESERLRDVDEDNKDNAEEKDRSDELSPNAQVRETGYQNNYVHATNVQIDDDNPVVTPGPALASPAAPKARPAKP